MKRSDCPPPPEKTKSRPTLSWSKFVSAHMESLVACDFFTKPVFTLRGRFDAYVLVFLHLGSRRVYLSQPTLHPDEAWVMQQAWNATMWLDDHGIDAKYLICDRDTKFTRQFDAFWNRAGVRCIRIPPKAPRANAFCESFIGTCKHQCLNHFVCFGLGQLAHINRVWLDYYHTQRPHQGRGNNVIPPISGAHPKVRSSGRNISAASSPGTNGKRRKQRFLLCNIRARFPQSGIVPGNHFGRRFGSQWRNRTKSPAVSTNHLLFPTCQA